MKINPPKYEKLMKKRPHAVILGAGASIAAIPSGDANGRKISVMNGFMKKLGMEDLLDNIELETESNNLENIYSELYERSDCIHILETLENKIYKYFSEFEIPDEPTIYDMLLLSLREKDVIATFNWDPLLLQAYLRVHNITSKLPNILFLHGNVLVGVCHEHKRAGLMGKLCPVCYQQFKPSKLLYPVKNKDYQSDSYIRDNWNAIKDYLKRAYVVTVFGYSAPKTDKAAIDLLKEAWGSVEKRNLEEIEIIDIRSEEDLYNSWENFIHTHHYRVYRSFFDSIIAKFPRRSCDATFDMLMNVKFLDGSQGLKKEMTFDDIQKYFDEILQEEENYDGVFGIE